MELDTTNQVQSSELYCRLCRVIGHRERDCRRKNNDNNTIMSILTALRDVGSVNYNPSANPPMQKMQMGYNNVAPNYYNRNNNYPNLDRLNINQNRNQNYQYYANQYQTYNPNTNRPNLNNNIQQNNAPLQQ